MTTAKEPRFFVDPGYATGLFFIKDRSVADASGRYHPLIAYSRSEEWADMIALLLNAWADHADAARSREGIGGTG